MNWVRLGGLLGSMGIQMEAVRRYLIFIIVRFDAAGGQIG
jgi:hypothetical protein